MAKVKLECGPDGLCVFCGEPSYLEIDEQMAERIISWIDAGSPGTIQDAFPRLTAGQRELIVSGIHEKCFDELGDDEDTFVDLGLEAVANDEIPEEADE